MKKNAKPSTAVRKKMLKKGAPTVQCGDVYELEVATLKISILDRVA